MYPANFNIGLFAYGFQSFHQEKDATQAFRGFTGDEFADPFCFFHHHPLRVITMKFPGFDQLKRGGVMFGVGPGCNLFAHHTRQQGADRGEILQTGQLPGLSALAALFDRPSRRPSQ